MQHFCIFRFESQVFHQKKMLMSLPFQPFLPWPSEQETLKDKCSIPTRKIKSFFSPFFFFFFFFSFDPLKFFQCNGKKGGHLNVTEVGYESLQRLLRLTFCSWKFPWVAFTEGITAVQPNFTRQVTTLGHPNCTQQWCGPSSLDTHSPPNT